MWGGVCCKKERKMLVNVAHDLTIWVQISLLPNFPASFARGAGVSYIMALINGISDKSRSVASRAFFHVLKLTYFLTLARLTREIKRVMVKVWQLRIWRKLNR